MNVKIPDWQYHANMVSDLAYKNDIPFILTMKATTERTLIGYKGKGVHIIMMICELILALAAERNLSPIEICDTIRSTITAHENNKEVK